MAKGNFNRRQKPNSTLNRAMAVIRERGPLTADQIAEALEVHPAAVAHPLKALVEEGAIIKAAAGAWRAANEEDFAS